MPPGFGPRRISVAEILRVAASAHRPPKPVRVRLQDASGRWAVVRAAQLAPGTSPGAQGGYAVTLEQARSEDLAPLLMRAWALSPRERDVARLVIDGLSNEEIAAALFISANTVRDHLKAIFGKTGATRRRDLTAALAGLTAGLAGLKPASPGGSVNLAVDGDRYAHGTVPPHSFQCVVSAVGLRLVEPNLPLG